MAGPEEVCKAWMQLDLDVVVAEAEAAVGISLGVEALLPEVSREGVQVCGWQIPVDVAVDAQLRVGVAMARGKPLEEHRLGACLAEQVVGGNDGTLRGVVESDDVRFSNFPETIFL